MDTKQDQLPLEEVIYKPTVQKNAALKPESSNSTSKFMFVAATIANLVGFTTGTVFGWPSPVLPKLLTLEDNPLGRQITHIEESWIVGLPSLGGIVGPFVAGYLSEKLGRKKTLLVFTCVMAVCIVVNAFANTILVFYICRLVVGVGTASTFTVLPIYLAEISEDHNRGTLGCSLGMFLALGLLFAFSVGPYLSIRNFCLVSAVPSLICIPVFSLWIPETPHFLASVNKDKEMQVSLAKLRNKSPEELKIEYLEISKNVLEDNKNKGGFGDLLKQKPLRKGLIITLGLIILQQFAGINAVLAYMQTIFNATGSGFSSEISTIIIGAIQLTTTIMTSFLVDKLGRRILLLTSIVGSGLSLIALGLFFYLKNHNFKIDGISWLPVVSLICFMIFFNIGLGPVPWAVMGELFPSNVKSVAAMTTTVVCCLGGFIISFVFPLLSASLGMAKSFWMFSVVCLAGTVFIFMVLPETKGKSLQEIQRLLGGRQK